MTEEPNKTADDQKNDAQEAKEMEETQAEAAEEREDEGGYQ